jgi:hypothetical protein
MGTSPSDDAKFARRKQRSAGLVRKNNAALPAGSPLYYYCKLCGQEMVRSELLFDRSPRFCRQCIAEGRARNAYQQ